MQNPSSMGAMRCRRVTDRRLSAGAGNPAEPLESTTRQTLAHNPSPSALDAQRRLAVNATRRTSPGPGSPVPSSFAICCAQQRPRQLAQNGCRRAGTPASHLQTWRSQLSACGRVIQCVELAWQTQSQLWPGCTRSSMPPQAWPDTSSKRACRAIADCGTKGSVRRQRIDQHQLRSSGNGLSECCPVSGRRHSALHWAASSVHAGIAASATHGVTAVHTAVSWPHQATAAGTGDKKQAKSQ